MSKLPNFEVTAFELSHLITHFFLTQSGSNSYEHLWCICLAIEKFSKIIFQRNCMMKAFLLRRGIYLILGIGALFLLTFFQSSTIELVSRDFRGFNDLYKNTSNVTFTANSNSQRVLSAHKNEPNSELLSDLDTQLGKL